MNIIAIGITIAGLVFFANTSQGQDKDKQKNQATATSTKINTEEENKKYGEATSGQADTISGNREEPRENGMPEKSSVTSPEKNMKVPKEGAKVNSNTNRNAIGR